MQAGADKTTISELLVLWQKPENRAMIPVATLSYDSVSYRFEYLPAARTERSFRPLIGFRDLDQTYTSDDLFPLFRERVMDPSRSDFERVVDGLDLDPDAATPWEQLVSSGGGTEGDTLQMTPMPHEVEGGWECSILLSGIRYLQIKSVQTVDGWTPVYGEDDFERILAAVQPGDQLRVKQELGNKYNPDALLAFTSSDDVVGYLPDWAAKFVKPLLAAGSFSMKVARVNPARAGWHLRLLVDAHGDESFDDALDRLRAETVTSY